MPLCLFTVCAKNSVDFKSDGIALSHFLLFGLHEEVQIDCLNSMRGRIRSEEEEAVLPVFKFRMHKQFCNSLGSSLPLFGISVRQVRQKAEPHQVV